MKKLIAIFGILALAACGGGDAEPGAAVEDTTSTVPAAETTPVVTPPADTTMAPATVDTTMPATTDTTADTTAAM
jgi:hypothetical protein